MNPYVARLFIYPIKSLDPVAVDRVTVLESGALKGDRTWAIFDRADNFVNGKRHQKIHALRSEFNLVTDVLSLRIQGTDKTVTFDLQQEPEAVCNWLETYFAFRVKIKQNLSMGFPDDIVSPGATIVTDYSALNGRSLL